MRWIKRLAVWFALAIAVTSLVAMVCFGIYDLREFQPRRKAIGALIREASPAERFPSATLAQLLEVEFRGDPSWNATSILTHRLDISARHPGLGWHGRNFLWWQMVRLHLSRQEQFAIVCSLAYVGRRAYGLEAGARQWFEKPLESLDEADLATLLVLARWPSYYGRPEKGNDLAAARDDLLKRKRAAATE